MEAPKRTSVYRKTDPEELVRLMAQNLGDRRILNDIFTVFHARYVRYIENLVKKNIAFRSTFEAGDLTSLAHDTLLLAKDSSGRYKSLPNADRKEQERRVKAWLGGIADNMYFTYVRAATKQFENKNHRIEFKDVFSVRKRESEPALPNEKIKQIIQAFKKLPAQDRDILGTYLNCEDQTGKIDPFIHDCLSRDWKQLPQNLRKIKQRALDKMRHTILKPLKVIHYEIKSKTSDRSNVHTRAPGGVTLHGSDVPGDTGTG
jgi:DNA-directed RNA polymerase specialized sigma24 family protein